ncbi:hypothetical protein [Cellulomonas soli]|uniref:Uncharacterized protein n=1 Tax=Cellulomonas soli TaxID=931535 RepID=A0A512PCG6_9CELL|nr:hypothetical protein [Cellulomonas soli]NYI58391.1 hypothetical protein [Cellulomonas soli]GEP68812.1 hypothetical protein CSO01_15270 [Cellulomonas soli]
MSDTVADWSDRTEIDQFGPWVLPVRTPEDVPPLFRPHGVDLAESLLVLKVPRPITRRDVQPGMDLYDRLLVVDPRGLTVLSRRHGAPGAYDVSVVPHPQITAVQNSTDLLDGLFVLHGAGSQTAPAPTGWGASPAGSGSALTVPYNGSQSDVLDGLAAVLRELAFLGWLPPAPADASVHRMPAYALGRDDVGLVSALQDLQEREPGLPAPVLQPRTRAPRTGWASLLDAWRPVTVHACVLLAGPRELHVLHRRSWCTTGSKPVQSLVHTVLPTGRTALVERPHPALRGVRVVSLVSGATSLDLVLPDGSAVLAALRGVPRDA